MKRGDDGRTSHESGSPGVLSEGEFASLYQSSWRTLWCVAVAVLNDKALAEDALQEAAIVGLRKRDEFTRGTSFVAWMSTIVRFVALNQARKTARQRNTSTDPALIDQIAQSPSPDAAEGTGSQEMFDDRVKAALQALPEQARQCLLLRIVFNTPYSEIAQKLGIPEGTAMSHVHRARRALRVRLTSASASGGKGREVRQR